MTNTTIIIGKNSNLSNHLLGKLYNSTAISSRDILSDINILSKYKEQQVSLIFNNFQPAVKLNEMLNAEEYIMNSIGSTSKVLNYCQVANINIKKIIYTSSCSAYGDNIFCSETDETKPTSLHASLKVANEKMIEKFCENNKINYTIVRLFNMYGGLDKFSIISKLISAIRDNKEITIVNHGNSIRDFIHIDDVVDVYKKLLEVEGIKLINIGTGIGTSVKSIIDFLKQNNINIKINNIFRDELETSTANIKLLNELLNKESFVIIEDYVKKELSF